jgi:hypothetical protein
MDMFLLAGSCEHSEIIEHNELLLQVSHDMPGQAQGDGSIIPMHSQPGTSR